MKRNVLLFATVVVVVLGGVVVTLAGNGKSPLAQLFAGPVGSELAAIDSAPTWLNSPPLTAGGLRGKVVLVDFWTYSCINWMRTQPYLRAWAEKYKDQGLVVIGVHTPEFGFEKELDNVAWAVKALRVPFPVVTDNDFAIWRAFDNNYWPALYLIDAQGKIRYHQFGEGGYPESEKFIQQLLAEAGHKDVTSVLVSLTPAGAEAAADYDTLGTGETYVGADRAEGFASPSGSFTGEAHAYTIPDQLPLNQWALAGRWTIDGGSGVSDEGGARIAFRFHARDVNLVMGPARKGTPVQFRVRIDGQVPGDAHGGDVDADGVGTLTEQRMYQLIRQTQPIADRTFEIEFLDPGAEAFSFTFG